MTRTALHVGDTRPAPKALQQLRADNGLRELGEIGSGNRRYLTLTVEKGDPLLGLKVSRGLEAARSADRPIIFDFAGQNVRLVERPGVTSVDVERDLAAVKRLDTMA
ncbi:MAG: hypothetical protein IPK79_09800 [Vampirovibrionales bacterium]|nr:hypothetical protein [Vampirovibrionales bacterium]